MNNNTDRNLLARVSAIETAVENLEEREAVLEKLKIDINEFLWTRLPSKTTLGRAEDMACVIHDAIFEEWEKT